MDKQFNSLSKGEVLSVNDSAQILIGHRTFRVGEFAESIRTQLEYGLGGWTEEKDGWFGEQGIDCEVLRFGANGWQKGKVRITLEFCPEDPKSEELKSQVTAVQTPASYEDEKEEEPELIIIMESYEEAPELVVMVEEQEEEVDPELVAMLGNHEEEVDPELAAMLGNHEEEVDPELVAMLGDHEEEVDPELVAMLGNHEEETPELAALLGNHEEEIDPELAALLGNHDEDSEFPDLSESKDSEGIQPDLTNDIWDDMNQPNWQQNQY